MSEVKRVREEMPGYGDTSPPPDFHELAKQYPAFAPFVFERRKTGRPSIDWRNKEAVRCLTLAILHARYRIDLELPPDQLCPTVTVRANYIRCLADLLGCSGSRSGSGSGKADAVVYGKVETEGKLPLRGIDIGTGASCVYPLLGARMMGWRFLATDISEKSLEVARRNVEVNGLKGSIELRKSPSAAHVFSGVIGAEDEFDFTMCNPPFFEDASMACQNPNGTCTAAAHESATAGGEVAFVGQMIAESRVFPKQPIWWTSMLGRKGSIKPLMKLLEDAREVRVSELIQGKTSRWVIAWSFAGQPDAPQKQRDEQEMPPPDEKKPKAEVEERPL